MLNRNLGVLLAILGFCLVSCSISKPERYGNKSANQHFPLKKEESITRVGRMPKTLPWQTWSNGNDLDGNPIQLSAILEGDDYSDNGAYQKALQVYQSIKPVGLNDSQRKALLLRVASTLLELDQPQSALKILSEYFKRSGLSVEQVDLGSALLFAYAYGRLDDVDQSLAWFSRIRRLSGAALNNADEAQRGVKMLLSSLPDEKFNNLNPDWKADEYINGLIGQERALRARSGGMQSTFAKRLRFWENEQSLSSDTSQLANNGNLNQTQGSRIGAIGVLLPLTGKYAAFGTSLRNGIDLALQSARSNEGLQVDIVYKDSGADLGGAKGAALDLIAQTQPSVILGPLLSEHSLPISQVAQSNRVPIITFSKSSAFHTSSGVYRLGPTAETQIDSLIAECHDRMHLNKFGVVYPDDENGKEFAQAFENKIVGLGLVLEYKNSYPKDDMNSLLAVEQDLEKKPELEAVFFPDSLQAATRFYGAFSPKLKERTKILGTASWDNPSEIANARSALNGIIFVSPFFSASDKPIVSKFVDAYKASYNANPDFLAAQGFDAATMVFAALKRKLTEGLEFDQAFSAIDLYDGLTGKISVSLDGELKRSFNIVQLVGENLVSPPEEGVPSFTSIGNQLGSPLKQLSSQGMETKKRDAIISEVTKGDKF